MANIRTARRSGRIFRGGKSVRESAWVAVAPTTTTITAAGTSVLFTGFSAATLGLRPFTVVRTRGTMAIRSDQAVATEVFQASLGFAVVSDQALAIGVTAVPSPETDRGSDLWFVYETLEGFFVLSSAIGIYEAQIRKEWDSRAMRKVEDGQDMAIVLETSSISAGCTILKAGRMLIKLH